MIRSILTWDPRKRVIMAQILSHVWLSGETSEVRLPFPFILFALVDSEMRESTKQASKKVLSLAKLYPVVFTRSRSTCYPLREITKEHCHENFTFFYQRCSNF